MINWNDFEHIHVIKKLKQILHSWWSVDIIFTDERGHLKGLEGEKVAFVNPAISMLIQKDAIKASLAELVSSTVQEFRTTNNQYVFKKWDAVGFDVCVFPILIENDFVGTVVATGFFNDSVDSNRISEVKERLAAFGCSADLIEKSLSKIQYLEAANKQHFCQLVELVAQEIVTLHVEISSREDRITELNKELATRPAKRKRTVKVKAPVKVLVTGKK